MTVHFPGLVQVPQSQINVMNEEKGGGMQNRVICEHDTEENYLMLYYTTASKSVKTKMKFTYLYL